MTENDITEAGFIGVRENSARAAAREMAMGAGGVMLTTWEQQVDYAKYMAASRHAIPKHLRDNIGACIAVIDFALGWGFKPYQVARHCYLVGDILAFESQLIHAVVEKFAPLKYRLRARYEGEGEKRKVIITGHFRNELDPVEYISPEIGKITPKNSPLWKSDPDQQLFYFGTNRWARRYCPDIILGAHDLEGIVVDAPSLVPGEDAKDITPVAQRLVAAGLGAEGFVGESTIATIEADLAAAGAEVESKNEG